MFFQMGEVYEKDKKIRRPRQAPRQLPQEVGRAGWSRPPGARALPPRRDGLEGVLPEGVGGRRLPGDQARRRHRPPEGPLRPEQEAEEGQEDQGGEAHAVRSAHQLEDRRSSTATSSRRPRRQEHFQTVLKIWNKGAAASKITGKDVEARAGLAAYAVAGAAFHMAEIAVRELPRASSSRRASTSSSRASTTPRRRPRPRRRRPRSRARSSAAYLDDEGEGARQGARPVPRGLQDEAGAVDDRLQRRASASCTPTSSASCTPPRSPRTSRSRTSGVTARARSSATPWSTRRSRSSPRRSRASTPASRPRPTTPGTTSGRVCASASSTR